ncbi:MAG: precorrin-8X methylmutase [Nitratireductor sp.]
MAYEYIKDPAQIYKNSFAIVEDEAKLEGLSDAMKRVAVRLVHSCGMVDIVDDLAFSNEAAEKGVEALLKGAPVYCDVEMVKAGIIERNLPSPSRLVCTLNDRRAGHHGKENNNTRSAAGVDYWDELGGSICVIGNAPTALFRLLERIEEGAEKPALIVGIPVGFVGAVESKDALIANPFDLPYIAIKGRRGGSAMASSVVNALSFLAKEAK